MRHERSSRSRLVAGAVVVASATALVLPGAAAAHGRGATIALDYRLDLDPASTSLPGVRVRVLDGNRALEARVDDGVRLLVRGLLREPLIRIDERGVWVNASSPTASSDGLVDEGGSGWVQVGEGRSLTWHDHRLAPPPVSRPGPAGRFAIPVAVDGEAATIGGQLLPRRSARGLALARSARSRSRRRSSPWRGGGRGAPALTVALGVGAGAAALVAVTTFARASRADRRRGVAPARLGDRDRGGARRAARLPARPAGECTRPASSARSQRP